MLDLRYFQNTGNVNTQTFTNAGTWVTWLKPRGAKFVNILCIGSGGGGGGGFQAAAGNKSGGSGGGGGGIVNAQFQASILPDILYVYTGLGGVGGTGGAAGVVTAGGNGEKSFVCITPSTSSTANIVVTSGAISARGGAAGSTVAPSSVIAETVATTANAIFLNLGTFLATAGVTASGNAGSLTSNGGVLPTSYQDLMTGMGGGGTGTGGGFAASGPFPSLTAAAINTNGKNGIILYKPIFAFMAGTGGGGGATGGIGGNGAYGSGGGGGGAGTTSAGNGGRGGNGIIIITTSF